MTIDGADHAFDPSILIEIAGSYLLGATPTLTRQQVAEQADIDLEDAKALWKSLGFAELGDDRVAFTPADVEAIGITRRLIELDIIGADMVQSFVRSMGRSFARLAEWQTRLLLASLNEAGEDVMPLELMSEVVPLIDHVQSYVWRRHLVAVASRMLLRDSTDSESEPMAVGFVDIVGYTTRSRRMTARELSAMVENFEQVTTGLITDHGGQVIKTIGDEVLYTVDDPREAVELALRLTELHEADPEFPQVRVGTAHGSVLSRFGDVFGPVVNLASRLTSIARPGRAVIDRELAELVADDPRFRIRRMRRTSVKGYENLEPWSLKRPKAERESSRREPREAIASLLEDVIDDVIDNVPALDPRRER